MFRSLLHANCHCTFLFNYYGLLPFKPGKTFKLVLFKTSMSPSIIFQLFFTLTRSLLLLSIVPSQFESIIISECIQLALGQMSKH